MNDVLFCGDGGGDSLPFLPPVEQKKGTAKDRDGDGLENEHQRRKDEAALRKLARRRDGKEDVNVPEKPNVKKPPGERPNRPNPKRPVIDRPRRKTPAQRATERQQRQALQILRQQRLAAERLARQQRMAAEQQRRAAERAAKARQKEAERQRKLREQQERRNRMRPRV